MTLSAGSATAEAADGEGRRDAGAREPTWALGLLYASGRVLAAAGPDAMSRVVALLVPAVGDLAVLATERSDGGPLVVTAAARPELAQRAHAALDGDGRVPVHANDDAARAVRERIGSEQLLVAPFGEQADMRGALIVSRAAGPVFTDADRLVVELLAQQLSGYLAAGVLRGSLESERAQAEEARRRADSETMLLGVVSHELRNPLAVMMLAIAVLKEKGLADHQTALVRRLETAGRQSQRLVSDLLDFTAARGVGITLRRGKRDLHAVVGAALQDLRDAWPGRSIEHSRTGDGLSLIDEDRMAQVVMNLVGNALQHSPPSSTVRVETRGEPDVVLLSVFNEGEPIPDEHVPLLFEPLWRGPRAGNRVGSLGLGLFIVRHLALAHGGRVDVASGTDGTRFDIRLPRTDGSALDA